MDSAVFWIGLNTPSSKNNRQWTGTHFIPSDRTLFWRENTDHQWLMQKKRFLEVTKDLPRPLYIQFIFVRKSKHKYDFPNMLQGILDAMKEGEKDYHYGWIKDDDTTNILPYPGEDIYDKHYSGCFIRVLKTKPVI